MNDNVHEYNQNNYAVKKKETQKNYKKTLLYSIILIVLIVVSIFMSETMSSMKIVDNSITSLDKKKATVQSITVSATASAAAITLLPGDAGTPIAEKLADVSEYSVFLYSSILLEKYLAASSGIISFKYLIPFALLLILLSLFASRKTDALKSIGIKIIIFALILYLVVPASIKLTNNIEKTYKNTTWEATHTDDSQKTKMKDISNEGNSILPHSFSTNVSIKDQLGKYKKMLDGFMDKIAILIVTTCIIPILVFCFLLWLLKTLFGVTLNLPKPAGRFRKAIPRIK